VGAGQPLRLNLDRFSPSPELADFLPPSLDQHPDRYHHQHHQQQQHQYQYQEQQQQQADHHPAEPSPTRWRRGPAIGEGTFGKVYKG